MTTPAEIIAYINQNIGPNGAGKITGATLEQAMLYLIGQSVSSSGQSRVITSSANFATLSSDYRIGLNRTASPAAMQITLVIPDAIPEIVIQDLAGNFNRYPVTILPPTAQNFAGGRTSYVMNEDNMTGRFFYWGQGIWGVEPA